MEETRTRKMKSLPVRYTRISEIKEVYHKDDDDDDDQPKLRSLSMGPAHYQAQKSIERVVSFSRSIKKSMWKRLKMRKVIDLEENIGHSRKEQGDEFQNSVIETVRLIVSIYDNHSLKASTFRMWILGTILCSGLSAFRAYFLLRDRYLDIQFIWIQIAILPIGILMATVIPDRYVKIPATNWGFSLNPGPFNVKEHLLISVFAYTANITPALVHLIPVLKTHYHLEIDLMAAGMMTLSTQLMGYGFTGLFIRSIVDPPSMWWPEKLIEVAFYRTWHEKDSESDWRPRRRHCFVLSCALSFAYHFIPIYHSSLSSLSAVCLIWKDSVTAHQIGSGRNGLGVLSFGFDWRTIASFTGDPLATPLRTIFSVMLGFILAYFIITPIAYWANSYNATRYPIISSKIFNVHGQEYNLSRIVNDDGLTLDEDGYRNYSKVHLSAFFAYHYGLLFASIAAGLLHVLLYYGSNIWHQFKDPHGREMPKDVHNRLMENYEPIPTSYFVALSVFTFCLAIYSCQNGLASDLQLNFLWVIVACAIGFIMILPLGIIVATTNQMLPVYVVGATLGGYLIREKPFASTIFKIFVNDISTLAVSFLGLLKLGQYMKIPPKILFIVQVLGSAISALVQLGVTWLILVKVENVCERNKLPVGSPWTCPVNNFIVDVTTIWGIVGPSRIFAPNGLYGQIYYFILVGFVSELLLWAIQWLLPDRDWLRMIHFPVIFSATALVPPAGAVNFWSWGTVGLVSAFFVYKCPKNLWVRYNYILSSSLTAGASLTGIVVYLVSNERDFKWQYDQCPLATCPTASGVSASGCPTVS